MKRLLFLNVAFMMSVSVHLLADLQGDLTNLQTQLTSLQGRLSATNPLLVDPVYLRLDTFTIDIVGTMAEKDLQALALEIDQLGKKYNRSGSLSSNITKLKSAIATALVKFIPPPFPVYQLQIDDIFNKYLASESLSKKDFESLEDLFDKCGQLCKEPKYSYLFGRATLDYFKTYYYDRIFKNVTVDKPLILQKALGALQEEAGESTKQILENLLSARNLFVDNKSSYVDAAFENKDELFMRMILNLFDFALFGITNKFNEGGMYKFDGVNKQLFSEDQKNLFDYIIKFFKTVQPEKGIAFGGLSRSINAAVGKSPSTGGVPSPLEKARLDEQAKVRQEEQKAGQGEQGTLENKVKAARDEYNKDKKSFKGDTQKVAETLENIEKLINLYEKNRKQVPVSVTIFKNNLLN